MKVRAFKWEHILTLQGTARGLFGKGRRNLVDKGKEARPCRPWPGVMILFKYMFFNWRTLIRGGMCLFLKDSV